MIISRNKIALVLLSIYGIVFAHNVVPHHHHFEATKDLASAFCTGETELEHHHDAPCDEHHDHDCDLVDHTHQHEQHEACKFDVQPVLSKSITIAPCYVISDVFEFRVPKIELPKHNFVYYPQKLLESYNFASPLRAPPVFS